MKNLCSQIAAKIEEYLSGKATLNVFQEWFTSATWDVEPETSDKPTVELVRTVQLYLAEYSNRNRTEKQLAGLLKSILSSPRPSR